MPIESTLVIKEWKERRMKAECMERGRLGGERETRGREREREGRF